LIQAKPPAQFEYQLAVESLLTLPDVDAIMKREVPHVLTEAAKQLRIDPVCLPPVLRPAKPAQKGEDEAAAEAQTPVVDPVQTGEPEESPVWLHFSMFYVLASITQLT